MAVRRDTQRPGWWILDFVMKYPDGSKQRVRDRAKVRTKRQAEEAESALHLQKLREWQSPPEEKKEVPTVEQFATEFLENDAKVENRAAGHSAKERILRNHLKPALGHLKLDEIGPRQVAAYKREKLADLDGEPEERIRRRKKSINNHLTVLRRMLNLAVEWEIIAAAPKVKGFKLQKPEFDFLDFDEADRLLAAAEPEWRAMILTALRTGLRRGELLALQWDDVDLKAGRLLVRRSLMSNGQLGPPKNGKSREVALGDEVLRALKGHRHLRGEFVFCEETGAMLTPHKIKWPLWRACKRAGLRKVQWHVMRHSFASHLVMRGVPLKAIQELLGHSTVEMTMRYAHLSPGVTRDAVKTLDRGTTDGTTIQRARN